MNLHVWLIPFFSAICWWATMISMLALWFSDGLENYTSNPRQHVMFISNVAARKCHWLFILGCVCQAVLFLASLLCAQRMRTTGRLQRLYYNWANRCNEAMIFFAILGQIGICLVAILDTVSFPDTHASLLAVFITSTALTASLDAACSFSLERCHPHHGRLRTAVWVRMYWNIVEAALAIAFIACQEKDLNASAIIEWVISFLYPIYHLILAWELWPATNTPKSFYPKYNGEYPVDESKEPMRA